ncbi:MAG: hypothetical protein O9972_16225 [Burkholderiales bacterium]|nr:hypothetical protein [Burkholderiales bacterium]
MPSIRDDLLALSQTPAPPALAVVIRDHLAEIEGALRAGRRYSEIIDRLRPHGLSPTVEIFRKTLARIRKEVEAPKRSAPARRTRSAVPVLSDSPSVDSPSTAAQSRPDYLDPAARRDDIEQWFRAPKPNPLFDLSAQSPKNEREGST